MTRRITISLPDDVAAYAEQAGANTSGFIASVLRRRMRNDALRAHWAAAGYVVTDGDVDRVRRKLATMAPISDEQHAENLAWLDGFDADNAAA
jgi:hypothetical protein